MALAKLIRMAVSSWTFGASSELEGELPAMHVGLGLLDCWQPMMENLIFSSFAPNLTVFKVKSATMKLLDNVA